MIYCASVLSEICIHVFFCEALSLHKTLIRELVLSVPETLLLIFLVLKFLGSCSQHIW